jgi:hypothetical protein
VHKQNTRRGISYLVESTTQSASGPLRRTNKMYFSAATCITTLAISDPRFQLNRLISSDISSGSASLAWSLR